MNSTEFKGGLVDLHKRLAELEESARKLQNQNFADIVASAKGRVLQLTEHPDLERVHAELYGTENEGDASANIDPKAADEAKELFQEPNGAQVGGPDRGQPDTYVPGDPRFQQPNKDFRQPNKDFRQPNAVDLNADGTLRQAPNSAGAQQDKRTA